MTLSADFTQALGVEIPTHLALTSPVVEELSVMARYGWSVETRYSNGNITASWAASKRTNRKTVGYAHELNVNANHLRAALIFLFDQIGKRQTVTLSCQFSASKGFVFTFTD